MSYFNIVAETTENTVVTEYRSTGAQKTRFFTTEQTFGNQLHTYTIVDAINDHNVLPFRMDYV